jgi:O-antigen/teichoic acid export membrane protein
MQKGDAIRGASWVALFTIINRFILPFVGIYIAGRIGVPSFGVFALIAALYTIIEMFREAGLGTAYLADKGRSAEREQSYTFLALASGFVFAITLFLSRNLIADLMKAPEAAIPLAWCAGAMLVGSLGTIPGQKMQLNQRFRDAGFFDMVCNITAYVVAIVCFLSGLGMMSLVFQMVIRIVLFTVLMHWAEPVKYGRPNATDTKAILSVSLLNMSSNIAYTIYTMADYVLISRVLGKEANGIYAAGYNLANKPLDIIMGPLRQTALVKFAKTDDPREFGRVYWRMVSATLLIAMPVYALIAFHSEAIVRILYPTEFAPVAGVLSVLCIYLGCRSLGIMAGAALVTSGNSRWNAFGWVPAYIVVIAMFGLRWGHFDLMYAVIALTVGALCCYLTYLLVTLRLFMPDAEMRQRLLRTVGIGLVSGTVTAGFGFLPVDNILALVGATVVALGLHVMLTGWAFLNNGKALLSRAGAKQLIDAL